MPHSKESSPPESKLYTSEQYHLGLERLLFFSDAVFAIAITVLVLDIHLPAGIDLSNDRQLFNALVGLWNKYLAYILSFWVIGLYWMNHHRKFLFIKRFDHLLLSLDLLFLMVIAFIPFPTTVISQYSNLTSSVFYAAVIALAGLFLAVLWLHATRDHVLTDIHLSKEQRSREALGPLAISAIFVLSIGVAFYDPGLVRLVWILIIPISFLLNVRRETA